MYTIICEKYCIEDPSHLIGKIPQSLIYLITKLNNYTNNFNLSVSQVYRRNILFELITPNIPNELPEMFGKWVYILLSEENNHNLLYDGANYNIDNIINFIRGKDDTNILKQIYNLVKYYFTNNNKIKFTNDDLKKFVTKY